MAWASFEEEALHIIGLHMSVMTEQKENLSRLCFQLIFLESENTWSIELGFGWNIIKWKTMDKVTCVIMWDEEHLFSNIRFAMIQELMKIGPAKYCIINSWVSNFESKLLLLIIYLPHEKMCFYPPKDDLDGPFLRSPWRELSKAICGRTLESQPPLLRTIIYTQQFAVLLRSRLGQQILWIEEP